MSNEEKEVLKVLEVKRIVKNTFWGEFWDLFVFHLILLFILAPPTLAIIQHVLKAKSNVVFSFVGVLILQAFIFDILVADEFKKQKVVVKKEPRTFEIIKEVDEE